MNSFVKYTVTETMNETIISKVAQDYLTNLTPTYRWMVYTYTSVQHTPQNAWKCDQSCFVTLNVPGQDNANFNILVIGVPLSVVGNSTLLK